MLASHVLAEAERLMAAGKPEAAVALVETAARQGSPDAQFQMAMWRLIGAPIARDLMEARCWLTAAARGGHVDAAAVEVALTANGTGGLPDFAAARALLASRKDEQGVQQLALLDHMALLADGRPAAPPLGEALTQDRRIMRFSGLFTAGECVHLARVAAERMAPALVLDPNTGRQIPHPVRTSDEAVISPTVEDLVLRALNLRIAAASGTDAGQGEALTILRYRVGQQFRPHHDALGRTRNERRATMLVYLNDGFAGGETSFPAYGLLIRPKAGDGVLFQNLLPDGRPDPMMRHAGEPVRSGVKWLATRWIRQRPFSPWTGPEVA